jgi:uncharacterized protein (TIRG00374 family)
VSEQPDRKRWGRRLLTRGVGLAVTGVALYVVAPSMLALLDAVPSLGDVAPVWFVVVAGAELASFVSLWALLRIALRTKAWSVVAVSQLAGNAASRVVPGGAAAGGVVQGGVLVRSGYPVATVGAVLSATGLLTTGMLFALPVLAVPAMLAGLAVPRPLEAGLLVSLVLAALLVGVGAAVLWSDRTAGLLARAAAWAVTRVGRSRDQERLARRLVTERDRIREAFAGRWIGSLSAAAGNRMFDVAALVASLLAVGADADPFLVLLAYVVSLALALVPLTPGGLGFVEAGLTSLLVLAGASTQEAVVATLLYRLASFWLPIPLGLVAWGGWRARRRTAGAATP